MHLNASTQLTGFLAGMFFAVSLACHPFTGPVLTKFDKRKLLIGVFVLGAAANAGYALFDSIPAFAALRFLSGIQYSFLGPLCLALCGDNLPKSRFTYGVGVYGIGSAIANAIGPSIGSFVLNTGTNLRNEDFGFTVLFLFGSLVFLLGAVPAYMINPNKKSKEDITNTGAWYKNIVSKHTLPIACIMMLIMSSYSVINTYTIEFTKGQGINGASLFFLVLALTLAVTRPFSGFLTDRLGIKRVLFPALMIFAFSLFFIGLSSALWMLLICAVICAVGYGSTLPTLQAMSMQTETVIRRGVATNTIYIGMDLGLFLGPLIGGFVIARTDYSFMFKTNSIQSFLAMILLFAILPVYRRRVKDLSGVS